MTGELIPVIEGAAFGMEAEMGSNYALDKEIWEKGHNVNSGRCRNNGNLESVSHLAREKKGVCFVELVIVDAPIDVNAKVVITDTASKDKSIDKYRNDIGCDIESSVYCTRSHSSKVTHAAVVADQGNFDVVWKLSESLARVVDEDETPISSVATRNATRSHGSVDPSSGVQGSDFLAFHEIECKNRKVIM